MRSLILCVSLALRASSAAAPEDARPFAARALAAYLHNQESEVHWNWTAAETRALANKAGTVLEEFPSVTAESVIRSGNRRCNAVVAWGDGRKPYMADADADARCQAMDSFRAPFQVAALLEGAQTTVATRTAAAITVNIAPDKTRLKSKDYAIRCAASIQATVKLDPATLFPVQLEGEVVEHGCDNQFQPILQYGSRNSGPVKSSFRKGATFHMEFAFQKDKFGHPENSYWIAVSQHYVLPWDTESVVLYYWGRQVPVTAGDSAHRLIKDVRTTAKEFGAESQLVGQ